MYIINRGSVILQATASFMAYEYKFAVIFKHIKYSRGGRCKTDLFVICPYSINLTIDSKQEMCIRDRILGHGQMVNVQFVLSNLLKVMAGHRESPEGV